MKKRSILLVDDEEAIRAGISFDLCSKGYDVVCVENGEQACEKLATNTFDLVITDLMMGGIDGVGVLKKTKELRPETLVIILTGYGSMEALKAAMENDVFDFLIKPCSRTEMFLKVKKGVEIIDLREQLKEREHAATVERKFVELLFRVTFEANASIKFEDTMYTCLKEICQFMKWPLGHFYSVTTKDVSAKLVPTKIWFLEDEKKFKTFVDITEKTIFSSGEGMPGEVLKTGNPKWITNIYESSNFPRAKMAKDLNVVACFAFPVKVKTQVVGVMEFFSPETSEPNERILEVMASIGIQMGRIFERLCFP